MAPWQQNYARWHLMFVRRLHRPCVLSLFEVAAIGFFLNLHTPDQDHIAWTFRVILQLI